LISSTVLRHTRITSRTSNLLLIKSKKFLHRKIEYYCFCNCGGKNLKLEYVNESGKYVIRPMAVGYLQKQMERYGRVISFLVEKPLYKLDADTRSVRLYKWQDEYRRSASEADLLFFLSILRRVLSATPLRKRSKAALRCSNGCRFLPNPL
jgi:hypothetical protein